MRCINCGADIPPEWVNAIQSNKCPGCGGEIMNSGTQDLLKELTEAIKRMPNDAAGIAGWLMSNYRFMKVGEAKPVDKFHHKGGGGGGDMSGGFDESGLKIAPNYSEFVQRNDAGHLVDRSNELAAQFKGAKGGQFAELASMIQSAGAADPYSDNTTAKDDDQVTEEDQRSYLELKQAGYDPFTQTGIVSAGAMNDLSQAINPRDVLNLLKSQGSDTPLEQEIQMAQTPKGRAILQMNELKRVKAQDAISGGGGSFRRAGG